MSYRSYTDCRSYKFDNRCNFDTTYIHSKCRIENEQSILDQNSQFSKTYSTSNFFFSGYNRDRSIIANIFSTDRETDW